ncbi:hypothetical protein Tco_0769979 [Tanacetum coccineum]|uniref:Transposase (Putative), gypsy type n=1 Tax=Tanacetum coccineum TaxID=301880 RepID=A0ABQ4ZAW4_9ASTR
MSLEESDDLNIPDATPVDPVLEACALPKFDMHLYKSSLNESHAKYLVKLYGIPEDLHPLVVSEGMTMNALPLGVIGLYAHHFQQGGLRLVLLGVNHVIFFEMYRRSLDITPTVPLFRVFYKLCKQGNWAAPVAMAWRHHDSSVADPFPRPSLSNVWKHAGRAFSIKDSDGKVITMAEFLRLPNFKGCKVSAGTLLLPSAARVTHPAPPAGRLEDIPPKTGDMMVAELPCRKVLDDKEKKKRKAEEKAAAKIPAVNIQAETVVNKDAGREGPRKKRRVHAGPQVRPDSEHVSSPTPLNHVKPLEALANEEHVSPPLSVGRMDTLRDHMDEHATPRVVYASKPIIEKGGQGNVGASYAIKGYGDNEGGLSELQTRLDPTHHSSTADALIPWKSLLLKILCQMRKLGLTDSSRKDNSRECRDMMVNLFTPADEEFFNKGVRDESAIRRSWKLLCQSAQQQANILLRFEALKEQYADLAYAHEYYKDVKSRYKECKKELAAVQSALEELEEEKKGADQLNSSQADRIKQLEEALKQSEADTHQLRTEKKRYAVEVGRGEMVRQRIINQYLSTFVRRLHQSAEYKQSLGEVFSLVVGKGFMDGISIGRGDVDVQAILKATPNVDPASSDTFIDAYEKLFDRRYPYVDKVARMYLLDPSGLQNIMPDETGPTPGGGPCDTPTASYA